MLFIHFTLTLLSVFAINAWSAPDKAAVCTACHGPEGLSANNLWPNLAGQKEDYLFKQLKAFHDGQRYDPLMTPIAKMLNEKEMRELASHYAGLGAK